MIPADLMRIPEDTGKIPSLVREQVIFAADCLEEAERLSGISIAVGAKDALLADKYAQASMLYHMCFEHADKLAGALEKLLRPCSEQEIKALYNEGQTYINNFNQNYKDLQTTLKDIDVLKLAGLPAATLMPASLPAQPHTSIFRPLG